MLYIITGGSGSGKSEYAENLAVSRYQRTDKPGKLYYIATMDSRDEESCRRIERHRKLRDGKGFITVECSVKLEELTAGVRDVVLLEDLSNLLANEMYLEHGRMKTRDDEIFCRLEQIILLPVLQLEKQAGCVIIVTNEVFSDGMEYDMETGLYVHLLGMLNQRLAECADGVAEVVCGIPVWHKGQEPCR